MFENKCLLVNMVEMGGKWAVSRENGEKWVVSGYK